MGMPACTITSQTAHGGIVMVGFPTVLINFMPASRIGDMHVCPMVTGIIPHVGGPFILGSPTVLVGFVPQSRVTDQLVCVGPPDIAMMGAETVLVGMAGAVGVISMSAGLQSMGIPVPMQPPLQSAVQATMQSDGTMVTAAMQAPALPPMQLQQPGWPDLPPENTATFQSVQPATIPQGTPLYAPCDSDQSAPGSYWSTTLPVAETNSLAGGTEALSSSKDAVAAMTVADPAGMKAWVGTAAGSATSAATSAASKLQVWTPAANAAAQAVKKFAKPGGA
jgi:uncharacterized Zn-binding protein involved in type VI secretion